MRLYAKLVECFRAIVNVTPCEERYERHEAWTAEPDDHLEERPVLPAPIGHKHTKHDNEEDVDG